MILVCPECSTHYEIPSALPDEGAKVRCTGCSHVWMATNEDVFDTVELAEESIKAKNTLAEDADVSLEDEGIPALSPTDEDPLEELDFEEIEDVLSEDVDDSADELDQAELDSLFEEMGVEMEPEPEPEPEEDNSQDDIDSLFDEIDEPEEDNSQDDIDNLFDEMGEDEGEENSQDDIDGLFDEPAEDEAEENSQDDIDGLFDEPAAEEAEDNSQDDIDGLFDEPAAEAPEEAPEEPEEEVLEDPFDSEIEGVDDEPPAQETPSVPIAAKGPFWKNMSRQEMIGWGGYSLSLLLVVIVLITARVPIVRAIPSMAGVYSALGMDVNVRGLTFANVQQKWVIEDNRLLLKVEGEVTNLTNRYKTLPPMVFGAVGKNKKEIFRWVMQVRKKPLLPGEKAPFMAKVPLPPKQAQKLIISFQ